MSRLRASTARSETRTGEPRPPRGSGGRGSPGETQRDCDSSAVRAARLTAGAGDTGDETEERDERRDHHQGKCDHREFLAVRVDSEGVRVRAASCPHCGGLGMSPTTSVRLTNTRHSPPNGGASDPNAGDARVHFCRARDHSWLLKAASNDCSGRSHSKERTNSTACAAPCSRLMPASSHSMEIGPE